MRLARKNAGVGASHQANTSAMHSLQYDRKRLQYPHHRRPRHNFSRHSPGQDSECRTHRDALFSDAIDEGLISAHPISDLERTVLETVDARVDRRRDACCSMSMGGDGATKSMCLLHGRHQLRSISENRSGIAQQLLGGGGARNIVTSAAECGVPTSTIRLPADRYPVDTA